MAQHQIHNVAFEDMVTFTRDLRPDVPEEEIRSYWYDYVTREDMTITGMTWMAQRLRQRAAFAKFALA